MRAFSVLFASSFVIVCSWADIQVRTIDLPLTATVNTPAGSPKTATGTLLFDQYDPSQYSIQNLVLGIDFVASGSGTYLGFGSNQQFGFQTIALTNRITSPGGTGSAAATTSWNQSSFVPGNFGSAPFGMPLKNVTGPVVPIDSTEYGLFQGTGTVTVDVLSTLVTSQSNSLIGGFMSIGQNHIIGTLIAELEPVTPVPEPATLTVAGMGVIGLLRRRRRKSRG